MTKRVTIRDIAAVSHTSITAVSLTLNNRPNRLSDDTKKRIQEAAQQLHYIPNQSARSLVSNHSMLLGLIVPDIENAYFAKMSKQVSDEAIKHGYTLIITNSNDSAATERRLLAQFEERGIDGVMVVPSLESFDRPKEFHTLVAHIDRPVVLMDRISSLPWCDGVGFDNYSGGQIVARYLLDQGHATVGVIAAKSEYVHKDGRIEGFLDIMKSAGATVPTERIAEGNFRYESGYTTAQALLAQGVTAIFCGNDLTALGARKRILELGLSVPNDISLVGYDNSMAAQGVGADLTTVDQDIPLMAATGVSTLIRRIRQASPQGRTHLKGDSAASARPWLSEPQQKMFSPTLIERTTVAPVRN
jgi:LacI family transcriptional regulator